MLNTVTMCQLYEDFCAAGTVPTKPSAQGFVNLMCAENQIMFPIFLAYIISRGYSAHKIEDYEDFVFSRNPDEFFSDIEEYFNKGC